MSVMVKWWLLVNFRDIHPDVDDRFSRFGYRSRMFDRKLRRGLRIDLILAIKALQQRVRDVGIDYYIRAMQKLSDHCPIWSEFEL